MTDAQLQIETFRSDERLQALAGEIGALAERASEPNYFYEPIALLPAIELGPRDGLFFAAAWADAGTSAARRLVGFLPLRKLPRLGGLLPVIENWEFESRVFGEPLIEANCERLFWSALLTNLRAAHGPRCLLRLTKLDQASVSTAALRGVLAERSMTCMVTRQFQRALLKSELSSDDYLRSLSAKLVREQKRRRKQLEKRGRVCFASLDPGQDAVPWIEELLTLEGRGWKGRAGVAAAARPALAAYYRRTLLNAHREGRLIMHRLELDERPISMLANVACAGGSAFSVKIAYDENYARFSPGVLLQMEYLGHVLHEGTTGWVDSCARPGHSMFGRIWTERRAIVSLKTPFNSMVARLICHVEAAARNAAKLRHRASNKG